MKIFCSIFLSLLASFLTLHAEPAGEAEKAEAIAPEGIGMVKYFFKGSPQEGQVLILRMKIYRNGKFLRFYDQVANTLGKPYQFTVRITDHSFFNPTDQRVGIWTGPYSGTVDGTLDSWNGGPAGLKAEIKGKEDVERYEFSTFIENYEMTKKRFPKLPDKSQWWTFGGMLEPALLNE